LDPNCASAHFNLAVTCVQAGHFADAESHYRQALPGRPTAATHNGLGFVLARQGRTDEAVAEFRKAIDLDPKFTPAYNNLADMLAQQGKLEEAEQYYKRSLAEKPSAAVSNALAIVLRRLGKMDEAADQFGKAKALDSVR
jgi:pentatricopeptide repeat protein